MQEGVSSARGALIKSYKCGQLVPVLYMVLGVIFFCAAGGVLYLSTILPASATGPVFVPGRRFSLSFSSPEMMIYFTAGLLFFCAVILFGFGVWQKKLRKARFELYEQGICQVKDGQDDYLPFTEIGDIYLFSSGFTAVKGEVNNLAYRRNENDLFRHIHPCFKEVDELVGLVRERYLAQRLPAVVATLNAGGSVRFNYLDNRHIWIKRLFGNTLKVNCKSLIITGTALQLNGRIVPLAAIPRVAVDAWKESVILTDMEGQLLLSILSQGIMSFDLFKSTLAHQLNASVAQQKVMTQV